MRLLLKSIDFFIWIFTSFINCIHSSGLIYLNERTHFNFVTFIFELFCPSNRSFCLFCRYKLYKNSSSLLEHMILNFFYTKANQLIVNSLNDLIETLISNSVALTNFLSNLKYWVKLVTLHIDFVTLNHTSLMRQVVSNTILSCQCFFILWWLRLIYSCLGWLGNLI